MAKTKEKHQEKDKEKKPTKAIVSVETEAQTHLTAQLQKTNVYLQKQITFKRNFLLSVVSGIGYALGASILAGILIAVLSATVNSISDVPILNKLINTNYEWN